MSELEKDPNQNLTDARIKLEDFIEKRGEVLLNFILTQAMNDTKTVTIMMALGMDPMATIIGSIKNAADRRLIELKGDSNAHR